MNQTSEDRKFVETCFIKTAEFDFVVAFPSKEYSINFITCCVANVLLTFSTAFLNAVTVVAYWRSSQMKKKTSYFLIMLLSLNDFGVGLLCDSTYSVFLVSQLLGCGNCFLAASSVTLIFSLCGVSFMTLFVLNLERYLGIIYPIFHRTQVTRGRLLVAVVVLWFVCAMEVLAHFIDEDVGRIIMSFTICLFLLFVMFMYTKIFRISRGATVNLCSSNRNEGQKGFLRKLKDAKSCLIVVGCSFLCFLPMAVTSSLKKNDFVFLVLVPWSTILLLAASTLNSVVFFWRNQVLRNQARKILRQTFLTSQ